MVRPTNAPRLAQIDPAKLAESIASEVLDHMHSLHVSLLDMRHVLSLPPAEETEIYRVVRLVAGYAQGKHGLDAPVQEYLISLVPLWSSVLDDDSSRGPLSIDTELGVVVFAAEGRGELVGQRGALSTVQLAALGGMAADAVGLLCRRGEIKASNETGEWRVRAAEARRWLAARGAS